MKFFGKVFAAGMILAGGAALLFVPQFASSRAQQMPGMNHDSSSNEPTPAFHAQPAKDALPPTMDPSLFDETIVYNSYTVAARVKKVLYQQPCYCHCDRSQGHGSLLDCFVSHHGSGCDICQREAFYSYEQTRKGKTAEQIREGIMQGEWQKVDIAKYQAAKLPPSKAAAR
jgi:hypothetical protein